MKRPLGGIEGPALAAISGVSVVVLVTMLVSFPVGAYAFNSPALGGTAQSSSLTNLPLLLFGLELNVPLPPGLTVGAFFLVLWCIYLAFLVLLLMGPWSDIVRSLKRLRQDRSLAVYSNGALSLGIVFPATLGFAAVLEWLLNRIGLPVGGLTLPDPRYLFLISTFAPLREELGFRVCFVGILSAYLVYAARSGTSPWKALWHPSRAMNEAGIQMWRQGALYAAIIGSSLVFGLAHVAYGGGWGIGKFFSAAIVGLIFAAIYVTHGFPAAVMLHWGFDYYQDAYLYFDQVRGVVNSSGAIAPGQYLASTSFLDSVLLTFAALLTLLYLLSILLKSLGSRRQSAFKRAEVQQPLAQDDGSSGSGSVSGAAAEVRRDTPVQPLPS